MAPQQQKNSVLREAFRARLAGSRFRILNEELYTTTSKNSYEKFRKHPELFEQYHEGFRQQVESWPENPVDIIKKKKKKKKKRGGGGNGDDDDDDDGGGGGGTKARVVVADFGCGDAQLARDLLAVKRRKSTKRDESNNNNNNENNKDDDHVFEVHSFDLVAPNNNNKELVTPCDMANVPLPDKSVDVCVFCLSLMGTNLADFIREAHRVLRDDGRVEIAEEGTLEEFTDVLGKLGFECVRTDRTNTMFLLLELKKNGRKPDADLKFSAKPCIYKRR
eukprot:jgi/Psemu1/320181/estExt_fgenesh1_pm.C_4420001